MIRKTITINVTQDDIDNGKRFDTFACPIAKSLSRQGFKRPVVGIVNAFVDGENGQRVIYDMPQSAGSFIDKFDSEMMVKPSTFRFKRSEDQLE